MFAVLYYTKIRETPQAVSCGQAEDSTLSKSGIYGKMTEIWKRMGDGSLSYNLKKIAEESGYSISTVSRVINGKGRISQETKEKILKIAREHQYVPNQVARSLKNCKTNTIGIIVPDIRDYFNMVIKAADGVLSEEGYSILLADTNEDPEKEESYIQLMYEKRVDGLILATVSEKHEALEMYFHSNVPVIFIDNLPHVKPEYEDCVLLDNSRASAMAVEYLVKEGHEQIAIIAGNERETTGLERIRGFRNAMEEWGLTADKSLMKQGNYQEEGGYRCMTELIEAREKNPFTAVYVSSYKMSCGALKAIRDKKLRIPEDVAVVAFDFPDEIGLNVPQIATITQPMESIGTIVANRIMSRIKNADQNIAQKILLAPELKKGDSSRKV